MQTSCIGDLDQSQVGSFRAKALQNANRSVEDLARVLLARSQRFQYMKRHINILNLILQPPFTGQTENSDPVERESDQRMRPFHSLLDDKLKRISFNMLNRQA